MNRNFFSAIAGIASLLLMASCSSDDSPTPVDTSNYETNKKIEEFMVQNYYWEIPSNTNLLQETPSYFRSLLNSSDQTSWISKISELTTETSYDIGFEYGANRYADGNIYYVIYYVRPNTSAAIEGIERGYVITHVNGVKITEDNKNTLLKDAAKNSENHKVKLKVRIPKVGGNAVDLTITAIPSTPENPIYESPGVNPIINQGSNNIGYFVYNAFDPNYDNKLIEKLQSFSGKINYLVVDLRYNVGGSYKSALTLASALVKNRTDKDVFLLNEMRLKNEPYNLTNTSGSDIIPQLGDQLKKVYVITGRSTQGIADAFINSLRPYLGNDVVVAGEESVGTNRTEGYNDIDNIWRTYIITGKWADKNGNSTFDTIPSVRASDVNPDVVTVLRPLGSPLETILAAVLDNIANGGVVTASKNVVVPNNYKIVSPSLVDKAKSYQSAIELK